MFKISKKIALFSTYGLIFILTPIVFAENDTDDYQEALSALEKNELDKYKTIEKDLQKHPLLVHVRHDYLSQTIQKQSSESITQFLEKFPNHYLAERLRRQWLYHLSQEKRWKTFLAFYKPSDNISLQCLKRRADYNTGKPKEALLNVEKLWLVGYSQKTTCNKIFELWKDHGYLTEDLIWQRFALAIDNNQTSLANYLAGLLPKKYQTITTQWLKIHFQPSLLKKLQLPNTPLAQQVIAHGIARMAKRRPEPAIKLWKIFKKDRVFSPQDTNKVYQSIAISLALKNKKNSLYWFRKIDLSKAKSVVREWYVRAALAKKNWREVSQAINALTPDERKQPVWQYWYARALIQLDKKKKADAILKKLHQGNSYYHFLARKHSGKKFQLSETKVYKTEELIQQINHYPDIKRSQLLRSYKQENKAKREWQEALKKMTKTEKHIATKLAGKWGWHDQVIMIGKKHKFDDHQLRYPLPMFQKISQLAKKNNIDPALIYAVIHQESAFRADAKSHAGAMGLMQLMPRTASKIAPIAKVKINNSNDVYQKDNNLKIGTTYLKRLLKRFNGNQIFATGAYNAGQKRIQQWIKQHPELELAIWIETRPWKETRLYMKRIVAKYLIYKKLLELPS